MTTLLIAEHDNKVLKDSTNKALTAAKALGEPVHVLVAGKGARAVAEAASKLDGVTKVLLAEGDAYEHMLAEPLAALIVALAPSYAAIVSPATTTGKNVMPRVAALLDVMQVSDIVKVISPDTFERLIYAGNAVQTVRSKDKIKVITVRTSTFQATGAGSGYRAHRGGGRRRRPGHLGLRGRRIVEVGAAGTDLRESDHFRWPGDAKPRQLH